MNKFDCILLSAGNSKRFCDNKITINLINKPLFMYSLDVLLSINELNKLYLVINKEDEEYFNNYYLSDKVELVIGGQERYISVKNALEKVESDICLIHDAARPLINKEDIYNIVSLNTNASYYSKSVNTLRRNNITINRDEVLQIETPQVIKQECYPIILNNNSLITDEIGLLENNNIKDIKYILMNHSNIKVTYPEDYDYVYSVLNKDNNYLIGHSYDVHRYTDGDHIILGGINIPYNKGILAHSDGDVYSHALCEAIYGALSNGDLGDNYPDNDNKYLNYDSTLFLKDAKELLEKRGYEISNIDSLLYLENPKLKDYKKLIIKNISNILEIKESIVSVKATTLEKLSLTGTGEGLAVEVVVLLKKIK